MVHFPLNALAEYHITAPFAGAPCSSRTYVIHAATVALLRHASMLIFTALEPTFLPDTA